MASVTYRHVYKRYGDVTAVRDLSIDIADKEFVVFVGPSGCGKSTSLRMLAGLEEISDGQILIGDRVVNDIPPKDRDIAMVFQSYALYPHMTVYDNMAFGLKLRKTPKTEIDRRVKEAADILGLMPLLDRKPKALSGGQRQRVAVNAGRLYGNLLCSSWTNPCPIWMPNCASLLAPKFPNYTAVWELPLFMSPMTR
ncbi:MAG: ABC transporter ATP-binding protein [Candidatus Promineifilaceae bacterium]